VKALEEARQFLGCNPGTGVADRDFGTFLVVRRPHGDAYLAFERESRGDCRKTRNDRQSSGEVFGSSP
jgi:hypothetical protein